MNLKIKWPRIAIPDFVRDLEHLARQLGVSQQIEEEFIQEHATKLAGSNLLVWQLKTLSRICQIAAAIKEQKQS